MVAYIITTNDTLTSTAIELEATQAFVRTRPGLTLTPIFGPSRAEFSISGVPWYYAVVAVEEQDVERIQKQLFHIVNTSCNDAAKTVATCHACGGRKEMAEREGHVDWVGRYKEFFVFEVHSWGFRVNLPLCNDAAVEEARKLRGVVAVHSLGSPAGRLT